MEGQTKPTDRLKFIESKRKVKVQNKIVQPNVKLIAAANNHNLALIGCEDNTIRYIEFGQLFDFTANQPQTLNQPATLLASLTFRPTLLSVARYGHSEILLVVGLNQFPKYPMIEVFDLDSKSSIDIIKQSDMQDTEIIDYAWHPSYTNLVSLCTSRGHLMVMAINKQDKCIEIIYQTEQYSALTCCWSMKGKNLAIGTQRGQVLRLEPVVGEGSLSFKEVNGSHITFNNPKVAADHQLVKLRWINSKYLIATHAKPNNIGNPETVYSVLTVKPGKPYLHWTNLNFESQASSSYVVHIANLSNSVTCISTATGEAATIGVLGASQAATNELNDWSALIIEDEGARIEMPLDANNSETHPCGLTIAIRPQEDRPILIFYTNDGLICSYAVMHSDNILRFPEHLSQPEQKFMFKPRKTTNVFSPGSSAFGAQPSFYQAPALGGISSTGPKFGEKGATFSAIAPSMATFTPSVNSLFGMSSIAQPNSNAPTSLFGMPTSPAQSLPPTSPATPAIAPSSTTTTTTAIGVATKEGTLFGAIAPTSTPPTPNIKSLFGMSSIAQPNSNAPTSLFGMSTALAQSLPQTGPATPAIAPSSTTTTTTAIGMATKGGTLFGAIAPTSAPTPNVKSLFGMSTIAQPNSGAPTSLFGMSTAPAQSVPPAGPVTPAIAPSTTPITTTPIGVATKQGAPSSAIAPTLTPSTPNVKSLFGMSGIVQPNSNAPTSLFGMSSVPAKSLPPTVVVTPANAPPPTTTTSIGVATLASSMNEVVRRIQSVREKLDFNGAYITLFDELNHLRDRFDETIDMHRAHHEALEVVKEDIDHLDLEVLETFYLIEYLKSRISCDIKKKTLDPITTNKVHKIKKNLKRMGTKLEELSDHVDVAWEDFVRRRSTKERRSISPEAIYKALATNQKIINVLKKKFELEPEPSVIKKMVEVKPVESNFNGFKEFLAARSVVPVRLPIQ